MPGKHAPASPRSFYLSVARAVTGALGVLALVVLIAMAAVRSGDDQPAAARQTQEPTTTATPTERRTSSRPTATATATATASETARPLRSRARVSVLVLNGTNRAGLAARTRDKLLAAGYDDVEIGDTTDRARSIIYYRGAFRPEAARLRRDIDVEPVREAPGDLTGDARLTLIIGNDFQE